MHCMSERVSTDCYETLLLRCFAAVTVQQDPAFILMRKRTLQAYLQELSQLVGVQEPFFTILCDALDLIPAAEGGGLL
jgi:hypothetical protein